MTAREIAERFEREYGCTTTEWLRWLPGAVRDCALTQHPPGSARVAVGSGSLALHWTVLPPRRIALISMPRMQVQFSFSGCTAQERQDFLRYFDLYMQRGGG